MSTFIPMCIQLIISKIVTHFQGGMYVFQLFDYYAGSRIILVVAFFECMVIAWIYGVNRFYDNLTLMLGFRPNLYMKISWLFITPTFTLV